MMSIDSPLFRGSQWFHCKNSTASAIPPYGIAECVGMDTAVVGDISQPVMLVRAAQSDNPTVTVFTGPIGVPASGIGLCHSGDFGYARTAQASFSIGTNQGVTSGSTSLARGAGDFFEIGDTFTISGTTIGLFHKKSAGGSGTQIQGEITAVRDAGTGDDLPFTGLKIATITVVVAPCSQASLIGTSVDVVDHSGCILDIANAELIGLWMWANEGVAASREAGVEPGTLTPCHWVADDRCCTAEGL